MTHPATLGASSEHGTEQENQHSLLLHAIEHAAHLLPSQGPISVFVHHNTMHAFQHLPFLTALKSAMSVYGCEPFLSEEAYEEKFISGRIRVSDIESVLRDQLGILGKEVIAGLTTRFELRLTMAKDDLQCGPTAELNWLMAETDALRRFRADIPVAQRSTMIESVRHWVQRQRLQASPQSPPTVSASGLILDELLKTLSFGAKESTLENWPESRWEEFCLTALWNICRAGASKYPVEKPVFSQSIRHRDALKQLTGQDSDLLVDEILIRYSAAFLDQGLSQWGLPGRESGFYRAFLNLFSRSGSMSDRWTRKLPQECRELLRKNISPLECIQQSLNKLGVKPHELETYLEQTFLALRGWGGMIQQTEIPGSPIPRPTPPGTLIEFFAVRLILECLALTEIAHMTGNWTGQLSDLRSHDEEVSFTAMEHGPDQRAFTLFQLAQLFGWTPATLFNLPREGWIVLLGEIDSYDNFERRCSLHLAYERRYRNQVLDAFHIHTARPHLPTAPIRAQVITCIDDREESFRRHLEEISPDIETFGAPGFFAVVMNYQGAADARPTPLCPIIIKPQHWVHEDVVFSLESSDRFRRRARKAMGRATHRVHVGTRTAAIGAVLATLLGPLASFPMIARILFPRHTARVREAAGQLMAVPHVTQLRLERTEETPGDHDGHIGFSVMEMANNVERLLRDVGLTRSFAPLVVILGHGSSSQNNPHESAYNCGACAGSRGGPNARAFAQMANDPRIRDLLSARGIKIPETTTFIGGYHNTCDDDVEFLDLDRLPIVFRERFLKLQTVIREARERNAQERCRRFESAPLDLTPEEALHHVEDRSEDLTQVRPEFNHATNAICFVGRRQRVRSLFMDRRSFLQSYDATQDDAEHAILLRILQAAIPVCAGINLEYYFSCIDPFGWGCGNKLPHNVVSMIGVMEGAQSDLRTGLSAQMVEIHEPIRILFVIEATAEAMLSVMERNAVIREHIVNEWIQLAVLDPHSSRLDLYVHGRFEEYHPETSELPMVENSYEWFRGWRDHLGFATVRASEGAELNHAAFPQKAGT